MLARQLLHITSAVGLAALLGACMDNPVAPANWRLAADTPALTVSGGPDLGDWHSWEGEVWLCKDGNGVGTSFTFDWDIVLRRDGTPVASGTTVVPIGLCVMAYHLDTERNAPVHISVTEQTPPANWELSTMQAVYASDFPGTPDTPVFDLAARTISGVHASNDVGVQVTITNTYTPPRPSCTYTQGYWKTHQELWDSSGEMVIWTGATFFSSGKTYAEMFAMSAAGGNSYVKLAHQYMAAKLNVNFGYDPTIAAAIAQAEAYFTAHAAGSYYIKDAAWDAVATELDNYNMGLTGPGHCPE